MMRVRVSAFLLQVVGGGADGCMVFFVRVKVVVKVG